jgi:hypothetical protein
MSGKYFYSCGDDHRLDRYLETDWGLMYSPQ